MFSKMLDFVKKIFPLPKLPQKRYLLTIIITVAYFILKSDINIHPEKQYLNFNDDFQIICTEFYTDNNNTAQQKN